MTIRILLLISTATLTLTACETWNGIKQDFSNLGNSVSESASNTREKIANASNQEAEDAAVVMNDSDCPQITVDPQLDSLSEFYDMDKPTKAGEISNLKLTDTASECKIDGEYLDVRIQLSFNGQLGPKAKRKDNDQPFCAYPYFVAVTDKEGSELSK